MLHYFINSGIKDTSYYWSELSRFVHKYCELKKVCPELDSIDIGGGFPIKTSIQFEYNYRYMIEEILRTIQRICKEEGVPEPNIFTEFGIFTVGESGANIYSILDLKLQNDKELWYMIDGSFHYQPAGFLGPEPAVYFIGHKPPAQRIPAHPNWRLNLRQPGLL